MFIHFFFFYLSCKITLRIISSTPWESRQLKHPMKILKSSQKREQCQKHTDSTIKRPHSHKHFILKKALNNSVVVKTAPTKTWWRLESIEIMTRLNKDLKDKTLKKNDKRKVKFKFASKLNNIFSEMSFDIFLLPFQLFFNHFHKNVIASYN